MIRRLFPAERLGPRAIDVATPRFENARLPGSVAGAGSDPAAHCLFAATFIHGKINRLWHPNLFHATYAATLVPTPTSGRMRLVRLAPQLHFRRSSDALVLARRRTCRRRISCCTIYDETLRNVTYKFPCKSLALFCLRT